MLVYCTKRILPKGSEDQKFGNPSRGALKTGYPKRQAWLGTGSSPSRLASWKERVPVHFHVWAGICGGRFPESSDVGAHWTPTSAARQPLPVKSPGGPSSWARFTLESMSAQVNANPCPFSVLERNYTTTAP